MEQSCKNCKFCRLDKSETSPGGMIFVVNYKCTNEKSELHNNLMNWISGHRGVIDSRENNSCNAHEPFVLNNYTPTY